MGVTDPLETRFSATCLATQNLAILDKTIRSRSNGIFVGRVAHTGSTDALPPWDMGMADPLITRPFPHALAC